MKTIRLASIITAVIASLALLSSCGKNAPAAGAAAKPARHEHKPPHGGTPVVLGDETYHLELVRDAAAGAMQAFVLDGELENFIRSPAPSFEIVATVNGAPQTLVFKPVASSATGETVGDTSLFETRADWLRTTGNFDGVLNRITIRGTTFADVKFNFPNGNDRD